MTDCEYFCISVFVHCQKKFYLFIYLFIHVRVLMRSNSTFSVSTIFKYKFYGIYNPTYSSYKILKFDMVFFLHFIGKSNKNKKVFDKQRNCKTNNSSIDRL